MPVPSWANVVLQLPLDGANGATTFTDEGNSAHVMTARGAAAITDGDGVFGGSCLSTGGSGDAIDTPGHTDFNFGTGNYTIEGWIKTTDSYGGWIDYFTSGQSGTWEIYIDSGRVAFYRGSSLLAQTSATINDGAWHHIAVVRAASTNFRIYIDGALAVESTDSRDYAYTSSYLSIGRQRSGSPNAATDMICLTDMVRIVKGEAVYTSTFTVPAAAFPSEPRDADSILPMIWEQATIVARAESIEPVSFGVPTVLLDAVTMHSLHPVIFGKPIGPNDRPRQARSMRPVRFGYPVSFKSKP